MKTVNTVLPVYNRLEKQCFHRSKYVAGDKGIVAPVITPRHRLPAILWIDDGDGCATVDAVYLVDVQGVEIDITNYFVTLPALYNATDDDYFQYKGDTLNYLLPCGLYYLKFVMDNNYIYYSEWLLVEAVYENLISTFTNDALSPYETLTVSGTEITSAINTAGSAFASSDDFNLICGESITLIFYVTRNSGTLPNIYLINDGWTAEDNSVIVEGLNVITLTSTWDGVSRIVFWNNATNVNFYTSEIVCYRSYSTKYISLHFTHECNLGDILYEDNLEQTLYLETEPMEPSFPYVEKGQENGFGVFVPTWQRQDKVYIMRTLLVAQFIVDVLHRLKLHDTIELTDLVGDEWTVITIDTEHEWQFDDKYYAMATISVSLGEAIVVTACCADNNTCK